MLIFTVCHIEQDLFVLCCQMQINLSFLLEHFVAHGCMQLRQNKSVAVPKPLFLSFLDCTVLSGQCSWFPLAQCAATLQALGQSWSWPKNPDDSNGIHTHNFLTCILKSKPPCHRGSCHCHSHNVTVTVTLIWCSLHSQRTICTSQLQTMITVLCWITYLQKVMQWWQQSAVPPNIDVQLIKCCFTTWFTTTLLAPKK